MNFEVCSTASLKALIVSENCVAIFVGRLRKIWIFISLTTSSAMNTFFCKLNVGSRFFAIQHRQTACTMVGENNCFLNSFPAAHRRVNVLLF